jgi:hypothetical protein
MGIFYLEDENFKKVCITIHGFKRFKLTSLSFWLIDMYILTKGQGLEWHMYFLTNQLDYSDLFY